MAKASQKSVKSLVFKITPWIITCVALYLAFRGVDWKVLYSHIGNADFRWLALAFVITSSSYLMRARRWQHLFPAPKLNILDSAKVLILGFFMNNILPARAGELVRAHMGAKVSGETRTLVLATVASERLADGRPGPRGRRERVGEARALGGELGVRGEQPRALLPGLPGVGADHVSGPR